MAFSIRNILSNIAFKKDKKSDDFDHTKRRHTIVSDANFCIDFEEPDSTSRQGILVPQSVMNFTAKKGSLSDTDVLAMAEHGRKKCKKLKLDIKQARSMTEPIGSSYDSNVENTPKHVLLDCQSSKMFSERLKGFNFNKSYDPTSDDNSSPFEEENYDIKSLSESESDVSADCRKSPIRMCRKVDMDDTLSSHDQPKSSTTPDSVEVQDANEEERMKIILSYQLRLEKINCLYNKFLSELRFQIDIAKLFNTRSVVSLPSHISTIPSTLGDITYLDNVSGGPSPTGSWNIVMEREDEEAKMKFTKQLQSMKRSLEQFIAEHLSLYSKAGNMKKLLQERHVTINTHGQSVIRKGYTITAKKQIKYFDFPDIREAMLNLFTLEPDRDDASISGNNVTVLLSDSDDLEPKCSCNCHTSQTDSGLATKTESSITSITSSLGNFTLDSSTLTAYSESLDQIVSYNSFQDTSLYNSLLQKPAIERITFYIQVHSIELHCEPSEQEFESKNNITFHCPSCKTTETEENGLMKHILSQTHCEKIHFQHKIAYIKRCVASGKEIQPSTVLNPMTMYRDDNKIVCFGDTLYACSLCFENPIVGESVLMAHCAEPDHIDKRTRLCEMLD